MLFLFVDMASAAGGSSDGGLPWKMIITQAGNFTVYVLLLGFLLRNKVRDYYKGKKESFEKKLKEAEEARRQAEEKQKEVLAKLESFENTFNDSLEKAKEQAKQTKEQMIADAKETAQAIKAESERTYQNQLNQAVQRLKAELLEDSVEQAEKLIQSKMQKQDHENLQENLVKSFGAVK